MKALELYSGIGGMHLALIVSGVPGEIVASIDINTLANSVYKHNFPATNLLNQNIQGLTANFINKLDVNTILMSPPCQPFTRNGLKKDTDDARTDSFIHILKILSEVNVDNILIENVKGFETSNMHNILIEVLKSSGYEYQEYILSPHQFGVPNTRHRYYCIATKHSRNSNFDTGGIKECIFTKNIEPFPISQIIENNVDIKYLLSDNVLLKRANILDVCFNTSTRSCCFTKAYGRYLEGTGSIYCNKTKLAFDEVYKNLDCTNDKLGCLKSLNLRYFTPKEISRLMCFPESFTFPTDVSDRQCYSLLGNSINVKVVAELIKLLNKS